MLHPNFIIRSGQDPKYLLPPILAALDRVHPGLRKSHVLPLSQFMINQLSPQREAVNLLGRLGALALALTVLGVYGMMSYLVRQRTREVGIRIAVGAPWRNIARLVTVEVFVMVLFGSAAGAGAGLLLEPYLKSLLYQIERSDIEVFVFPALTIASAVLLAALPAVIRAIRTDAAAMLRTE